MNNFQPFIHKLTHGYISSILCKTNFGIIYLTPTWNEAAKKQSLQNPIFKSLVGTKNWTTLTVKYTTIGKT